MLKKLVMRTIFAIVGGWGLVGLLLSGCVSQVQSARPPGGLEAMETALPQPTEAPLLLVTQDEDGSGLQGWLIDPVSLADLPEHAPINFGHHYIHAISPDGRTLALIRWPSGRHNRSGVLHLIDLLTRDDRTTEITFDDHVNHLAFAPDGRALYWAKPTQEHPAHGMPRDYELYRYQLDSGELTVVTRFPSSFIPWEMRVLRGGSRLAVYGVPTDPNNLVEDVPHVLLTDLAAGRIAADVRLDGITAGQLQLETSGEDEYPYRIYRPGLAWDLARSRLYIVHADADRVTVVNLAEGEILKEAAIRPRLSRLDRFMRWLVPAAEAKMVPGTDKEVMLSPDGRRLYVTGLRSEVARKGEGQDWSWREVPLGLQVIATDDLTELRLLDLPVNEMALSPDGRWLLLAGAQEMVKAGSNQIERVKRGLYLFDAQRLEEAAHLQPDVEFRLHGFSPDGQQAYVSSATSERQGDRWGNWRVTLHVLDLEAGRFVAEREFAGWLLRTLRSRAAGAVG